MLALNNLRVVLSIGISIVYGSAFRTLEARS